MSIDNFIKKSLLATDEPLSSWERARIDNLPSFLNIDDISLLLFPTSTERQKDFKKAIKTEIINGNIDALTVSEYTRLSIEDSNFRDNQIEAKMDSTVEVDGISNTLLAENESELVGTSNAKGIADNHGNIELTMETFDFISTAINEADILPEQEPLIFQSKKILVLRRGDFREWLENIGAWPLKETTPLSKWWSSVEREQIAEDKSIQTETDKNIFRKERGDKWLTQYYGVKIFFNDLVGMRYIRLLLGSPGIKFHVQMLQIEAKPINLEDSVGSGGVLSHEESNLLQKEQHSQPVEIGQKSSQELIDKLALDSYKSEVKELERQIVEAQENKDFARKAHLEKDRESLITEILKSHSSIHGIRLFSDDVEHARKAVSMAVSRALEKIEKKNEKLHKHLKNNITLGHYCIYNPEKEVDWIF